MSENPPQGARANPFGMDENCRNCAALCEARTRVVHGYGDVAADVCFVGERPSRRADETGVPFAGDDGPGSLQRLLQRVGLCDATGDPDRPELENAYLTALTRCRHPERSPSDEEIDTCEPYLDAEIRMINPEVIVPIGQRALTHVGTSYTTTPAEEFDVVAQHATSIRGRGFELFPMVAPRAATDEQRQTWVEACSSLLASDYRQTKGRRGR